jgi:hypothetical protein
MPPVPKNRRGHPGRGPASSVISFGAVLGPLAGWPRTVAPHHRRGMVRRRHCDVPRIPLRGRALPAIDGVDGFPCRPFEQHPTWHIAMPEAGAIHPIRGAATARQAGLFRALQAPGVPVALAPLPSRRSHERNPLTRSVQQSRTGPHRRASRCLLQNARSNDQARHQANSLIPFHQIPDQSLRIDLAMNRAVRRGSI